MSADLLTPAVANLCRTCSHVTTEPGNVSHYKVGLRNCDFLPSHRFVGGGHTCEKWTARATEQAKEVS
jgi:hypothetical protein